MPYTMTPLQSWAFLILLFTLIGLSIRLVAIDLPMWIAAKTGRGESVPDNVIPLPGATSEPIVQNPEEPAHERENRPYDWAIDGL